MISFRDVSQAVIHSTDCDDICMAVTLGDRGCEVTGCGYIMCAQSFVELLEIALMSVIW